MIKNSIHVLLSAFFATCLISACQTVEPEETPDEEEVEVSQQRTTIPFSIKVNTETKVSYSAGAESEYSFKAGDCLHVVGTSRADLEGTLTRNGDLWSGELSYLTASGAPATDEALTVTLVHADNAVMSKYASAIVIEATEGRSSLLQEAVEKYSLFTAATTLNAESAILYQQATFLDVTVTFDFDGTREVEAGYALVDLITARGEDTKQTPFNQLPAPHAEDFQAHFMAVVEGGQTVSDFTLTVGDRAITFADPALTLVRNNNYTVSRTVTYKPQLGDPLWSDGTYGRLVHPDANATIVGIIVYVNHEYETGTTAAAIDDAITEKAAGYGHGLAMALHNVEAGSGSMWGTGSNVGGARWSLDAGKTQLTQTLVTTPSGTIGIDALNGLDNTNKIIEAEALGANSAAYLARNYNVAVTNTSGWFLPSIGQWIYTISVDGFGGADHASNWQNNDGKNWLTRGSINDLIRVMNNNGSSDNLLVKSLNDRLQTLQNDYEATHPITYDAFGWSVGTDYGDNYWTSTEYDANYAFRMNLGSVETDNSGNKYSTIKAKQELKTNYYTWKNGFIMRIRPFLAF
ncbi:MAG: hypothetical protein J5668_01345 [Bacteroidales bacterium]|nr:hypothetical protein [Bacteroidales bacterium]